MQNILAPSLLSADFTILGKQLEELEAAGTELIHVDIMDGNFVPNISMGFPVMESIHKATKLPLDAHLMILHPEQYVEMAANAGASIITVHAEAAVHLQRVLSEIKRMGCKAGVALNPGTPLSVLDYVMDDVDMVLIMTVNPGFGGQNFIPAMMQKIADCRAKFAAAGKEVDIELDGGITLENVKACQEAGANIFVSGSSVFKGDIGANVDAFNKVIK